MKEKALSLKNKLVEKLKALKPSALKDKFVKDFKAMKEGFLDLFVDINLEKGLKLASIAIGLVGIIYACVYIFSTWIIPFKGQSKFFYGYFLVPLFAMIFATIYLLKYLLTDKNFSYVKLYVVLSLVWGICWQFVMPGFSGPDEPKHYFSAYHASNIMMGIKDRDINQQYGDWIPGTSYFKIRAEDVYTAPQVDVTFPNQYQVIADGCWFNCPEEGQSYVHCFESPGRARRYLVSGLGITIARLLNWGFVGTLFMGRFMNVLFVTILGAICIKIIPIGKAQIVIFMLFPELITLCGSYSYDNMSILLSLLLLSICLYYSQPEVKLHIWDMAIFAITVVLLLPNKQVYALFAIWFFAIPLKKWWEMIKGKKWYDLAGVAVLLVGLFTVGRKIIIKYYYVMMVNVFWKWDTASIEQDGRQSYSMDAIIADPMGTIKFWIEGIKVDFWYNLKHVVGSELGHVLLCVEVPLICTIAFMVIIVVSLFIKRGKGIKVWQKIVIGLGILVCLAAIFLGCLVRFTPLEGSERVQVSYRYLIPLYMALVVMFGTDKEENKGALALIYLENFFLIFSACHAFTYLLHLRDGM